MKLNNSRKFILGLALTGTSFFSQALAVDYYVQTASGSMDRYVVSTGDGGFFRTLGARAYCGYLYVTTLADSRCVRPVARPTAAPNSVVVQATSTSQGEVYNFTLPDQPVTNTTNLAPTPTYVNTPVYVAPNTQSLVSQVLSQLGSLVGLPGPKGDKGDKGDTGAPGTGNTVYSSSPTYYSNASVGGSYNGAVSPNPTYTTVNTNSLTSGSITTGNLTATGTTILSTTTVNGTLSLNPVASGSATSSLLVYGPNGEVQQITAGEMLASNTTNVIAYGNDASNTITSTVNGVVSTTTIGSLNNVNLTGTTTSANIVNSGNFLTNFLSAVTGYISNLIFDNATGTNITATGTANLATVNSTTINTQTLNASTTNSSTTNTDILNATSGTLGSISSSASGTSIVGTTTISGPLYATNTTLGGNTTINGGTTTINGVVVNNAENIFNSTSTFNGPVVMNGELITNATVTNNGPIVNNGTTTNNGEVINNSTTTNNGTSIFNGIAQFFNDVFNYGNIFNYGTTTNNGVVINNNEVINNATTTNNGPVVNNGPVTNYGTTTLEGPVVVNGTTTFNGVVDLSNASVTFPNSPIPNATITNLVFTNATGTNLTLENASITNATVSNLFADILNAFSAFFTNLTATNATVTNLVSTNSNTGSTTATSLTVTGSSTLASTTINGTLSLNPVASGSATSSLLVYGPNGEVQQITAGEMLASNTTNVINYTGDASNTLESTVNGVLSTTSIDTLNNINLTGTTTAATITAQQVDATGLTAVNATLTNATTSNLFATNASITNATTSNFFADILSAITGYISNLIFDNATGTNLTATGTASLATIVATTTNTQVLNASTTNTIDLSATNATITNLVTDTATFGPGTTTITGPLSLSSTTLNSMADNGLSAGADGKIEWGGALHQNTLIDGILNTFSVDFLNTRKFNVIDTTSLNLSSLFSAYLTGHDVTVGVRDGSATGSLNLLTPNVYNGISSVGDIPVLQDLNGKVEFQSPASILASSTTHTIDYATSTEVLTSTVNGIVATTSLIGTLNNWYSTVTDAPATSNTENIYQMANVGINNSNPIYTLDVNGMLNQTATLPSGRTTAIHSGDNIIGAGLQGAALTTQNAGVLGYAFTGDSVGGTQSAVGINNFAGSNGEAGVYINTLGTMHASLGVNTPTNSNDFNSYDTGNSALRGHNNTYGSYSYYSMYVDSTNPYQEWVVGSPSETQAMTLTPNSFGLSAYPNTRDDSTTTAPINFLYTDNSGKVLSSPLSTLGSSILKYYSESTVAPNSSPLSTGANAVAIGDGAQALATSSYVFGRASVVSGIDSYAYGYQNTVSKDYAYGIGNDNITAGNYSMLVGADNRTSGDSNYVFGYTNRVDGGQENFTVGNNNVVSGVSRTLLLGQGLVPLRDQIVEVGPSDASKITIDTDGRLTLRGALNVTGSDGTAGQILQSAGASSMPVWVNASTLSTSIPVNNGLTNNAGTIQLGGPLVQNTVITHAGNRLTYDLSSINTQTGITMGANVLTTGTILDVNSSYNLINSTNGIFRVINSSATQNGVLARFQSNNVAGSGMTILANGNTGFGTTSPLNQVHIASSTGAVSGLRLGINSTSATTTYNNKQLTVNANGDVVVVDDAIAANVGWSTTGNTGLNAAVNFLGTNDNQNVVFKRNGVQAGLLDASSVSFGVGALNPVSTGTNNVAFGVNSLFSNTSGNVNVAIGAAALRSNTLGGLNTAVGHQALRGNIIGNQNTSNGYQALYSSTGDNNTAMGYKAGLNLLSGSNNIAIGSSTDFPSNTGSNQMNIANMIFGTGLTGTSTSPTGYIGIGITAPGNALHIASSTGAISGLRLGINSTTATTTANGKLLTVNASGDVVLVDAAATNSFATANNGLTATGTTVQLGGSLIQNTTISNTAVASGDLITMSNSAAGLTGSVLAITSSQTSAPNGLLKVAAGGLTGFNAAQLVSLNSSSGIGLAVSGGTNYTGSGLVRVSSTGITTGTGIEMLSTNNALNSTLGLLNISNTGTSTSGRLASFKANGNSATDGLYILTNGNIGIGTTSPLNQVHIASSTGAVSGLRLGINASSATTTYNNKQLTVDANGDVVLVDDAVAANKAWSTLGNLGTVPATNFLGTIDNQALVFRTNNLEKLRITTGGRLDFSNTLGGGNNVFIEGGNEGVTGNGNTSVGGSLFSLTSGSQNSAFGLQALSNNTTGSQNTAIGYLTQQTNVAGSGGVAVGAYSQRYLNPTATAWINSNVSMGNEALRGDAITPASNNFNRNVAIGDRALIGISTGNDNVAMGYFAGKDITAGSGNVFLGASTGYGITTGTNNTILGANVTGLTPALSNNIIIADGAGNRRINVIANGNTGIGTITPGNALHIASSTISKGVSGLRLGITNASTTKSATTTSRVLSVDANGDVIMASVPGTQNVVDFFVNANPNTAGTTFTPNQPQDGDVIYVSDIDNSTWIWDGTAYVTYTAPASTEWMLTNSTTDAGSNKNSAIWRNGSLGIGTSTYNAIIAGIATSAKPILTMGTQDVSNTGVYSAVLGRTINNSGQASLVTGWQQSNTGHYSSIFGRSSTNTANYALVGGYNNSNQSDTSIVVGTTLSNGTGSNNSAIFGSSNDNSASGVIVAGYNHTNTSAGANSAIFGNSAYNTGAYSLLAGRIASNTGAYSLVTGNVNTNTGPNSFVGGSSNINEGTHSILYGSGNQNSSGGSYSYLFGASASNTGTYSILAGSSHENFGSYNAMFGSNGGITSGSYNIMSGVNNLNNGSSNAVFGQSQDNVSGNYNIIAGYNNTNSAPGSAVLGYQLNNASNYTALFGYLNSATGSYNVVGGYSQNVDGAYNLVAGNSHVVTGSQSIVGGSVNAVSGIANIVGGYSHNATGTYSIVTGYNNDNSGNYSAVFGQSMINNGTHSVLAGVDNTNDGTANTIFGSSNMASGTYSLVAGGSNSLLGGTRSFMLSSNSTSNKDYSLTTGLNHINNGERSAMFNNGNENQASYSFTAGSGNINNSYVSTIFGRYAEDDATQSPTSWVGTNTLFVVGNGGSTASRNNAMTLLKNGSLGLGTSTPARTLHLNSPASAFARIESESDVWAGTEVKNTLGQWYSGMYNLTNDFVIRNQAAGTDPLYIDGTTGFIGMGTIAPTANLHTAGTVRFQAFGAGTLTTDASGNVTASSDERLKDIEGDFTRGLEDLKKIKPITYKWNDISGLEKESSYSGFSAQNVQSAIPEAVSTDPRGYLSLQERPILATVVNAIKELADKIEKFADEFTSKKINTEQLCIGATCLSEEDIKNIKSGTYQAPATAPLIGDAGDTTTDSTASGTLSCQAGTQYDSASNSCVAIPSTDTTTTDTPVTDVPVEESTIPTPEAPAPEPVVDTTTTTDPAPATVDTTITPVQ